MLKQYTIDKIQNMSDSYTFMAYVYNITNLHYTMLSDADVYRHMREYNILKYAKEKRQAWIDIITDDKCNIAYNKEIR